MKKRETNSCKNSQFWHLQSKVIMSDSASAKEEPPKSTEALHDVTNIDIERNENCREDSLSSTTTTTKTNTTTAVEKVDGETSNESSSSAQSSKDEGCFVNVDITRVNPSCNIRRKSTIENSGNSIREEIESNGTSSGRNSLDATAAAATTTTVIATTARTEDENIEHSLQLQTTNSMSQPNNLNNSVTSMNSNRSTNRSFSAFPPIRFTRTIQNSNWRENFSNNLTSVIQEFRPVFAPHNTNSNNRGFIANLSNYRVPSNSSFR